MLQAIIFDFDGVIADSEPLHYAAFRHVLAEERIPLTESQYYTDYIAMDDKGCFSAILSRDRRIPAPNVIADLIRRKSIYFNEHVIENLCLFGGAVDFIAMVTKRWPLAIVSGALRDEIELILSGTEIRAAFQVIISAEDVNKGKPDPEGFLKGLEALNQSNRQPTVKPADCLVIEDTISGVEGAKAAGMRCLAVTNTVPREALMQADAVTNSLLNYDIDALERRLWDG